MSSAKKQTFSQAPQRKRILLVDDHPIMRRGQADLLGRESDLVVCGEAGSAREAMEAIPKVKPDLVVLDLNLPDKDGIEVIKDIQALHAGLPVIAVSMNDEALYAPRVLRAGGRGYVTKQEAPEKIVSAIRAVLRGQIAISEKMSARIVEVFSGQKSQTASTPEDQLSDRELEILRHYGEGWSTEEIGAKLHLSPKTVDVHRANIKQKLGLQTTPEFLRFAIKWNAAQGRAPS